MEQPNKEICTIRIMFVCKSDEQAISCKKKISEVIANIPDVKLQFGIMSTAGALSIEPQIH